MVWKLSLPSGAALVYVPIRFCANFSYNLGASESYVLGRGREAVMYDLYVMILTT
jgi:hypothetical protein